MKLKINGLLTLFLALVVQIGFAQTKTVSGIVTDPDGSPLPGVNVLIEGQNTGTQTDFNGTYSIEADSSDRLVFSYVGFDTQIIAVGSKTKIDVNLQLGEALDEVVVVGYGSTTKRSFTGSASVVEAKNIESKNFSNVSQSLAGEASGVTVINTSGQPGTTSTVRIRGFGSVNGNRDPLYVVDGVPYSGSLNAINPNDIKSTVILKDASATAIYGSRGANGVVLITTKAGKAGESFIEVDMRTGVNTQLIPRYDVITSPEEAIGLVWEAKVNRERLTGNPNPVQFVNDNFFGTGGNAILPVGYNMWNVANGSELIDPATGMVRDGVTRRYTPERYEDVAFNPDIRTEANIRMGGGDEKTKYFFSGGFLDDNGYAIRTSYKRYNTRLNLDSQVKDWLKVGANLGYTVSESVQNGQTNGAENLFEFADKMNPFYPVYLRDDNYELVPDPIFGGNQLDYGSSSGFRDRANSNNLNPIGSARYDFNGSDRNEFVGSFNANVDIVKNLTFETTFGFQYSNNVFNSMGNQFYGVSVGNGGDLFQSVTETTTMDFLQLLRYENSFGDHNLELFVAHQTNEFDQSNTTAFKSKAIIPGGLELSNYITNLTNPEGFTNRRTLESYFGQGNYNFDDKYFLSATIRQDGSSRFANDKWGTFGSIGAAWVLSQEDFLSDYDMIDFLKLKASFGVIGDENIPGFYRGINTFAVGNVGGGFSIEPSLFANPDLTWEESNMYQVGVQSTLMGWLDVNLDYYIKDTENLIFSRRQPPSSGVAIITVNDGVLRNSGLEFDLNASIVDDQKWGLDVSLNGAMYDNQLKTMPIEPSTGEPAIFQNVGAYGYSEGASIFDFYMREYAGVDPADGYPMWWQYFNDTNGNGIFDSGVDESIQSLTPYLADNPDASVERQVTKQYANSTEKYVGKSGIPDLTGAFRINARYDNFTLSTQFTYSVGGYAYDSQYAELMHDNNGGIVATNRHTDVRNRWRQPGDITDVPRIADRVIPRVNAQSTRFITRADFLALNNILLNYNMPEKFLESVGVSNLDLYVSGDNLFISSSREGFNPTTSQTGNSGRGRYAPLSTFTFGLRARF
ncbi:SusC/RagA family TonB-linked outer membrane protein [Psychroflexus sp. YR1-1]|uniref:SusC/RagA family TonB-linked outer membrane protein n=1 Tax=Psychroflexus aurantiacus TaxID=2709310 RepID=A0A6B3R6L2_9FLAO|nr:SusC/RagA family TonB-linked outer membrane protein [Psychroflexus aurantiacus]NEV94777.1 SusC/RagA family TonB-linked outer membrane protein [Psychroflexus aurantiacus]